jgi:hypothetical protein
VGIQNNCYILHYANFPKLFPDAKLWQNFLTRSDKNYVFHLEDFPHMSPNSYQECMCIYVSHMITCMSCPNTNTVKLRLYILCGDPLKCHKTWESVKPGNTVLMDIWPGLYKKGVKLQKTQYCM